MSRYCDNLPVLPVIQLQSKAESKAKRLGWGARLEAAAQSGAGAEVRAHGREHW